MIENEAADDNVTNNYFDPMF